MAGYGWVRLQSAMEACEGPTQLVSLLDGSERWRAWTALEYVVDSRGIMRSGDLSRRSPENRVPSLLGNTGGEVKVKSSLLVLDLFLSLQACPRSNHHTKVSFTLVIFMSLVSNQRQHA